ncbi:MAG: thiosulfate sulfurtransferase [Ectothiorhodospiraceae bacterium]|nr:thiosulfate sulfurtransferase [Chromatiales bacterium]MCP5153722.1 thiosulfate sulfurtransferase [Ectothiorhodospiraceae bacterium]
MTDTDGALRRVDAEALRARIVGDEEIALLDAREEGVFSQSHILYASCLALSRLEMMAPAMLARRAVPIVTCDDGEGLAERAARRLLALGFTDVAVLDGGIRAWAAAGFELFSGVNVPSKAFGELVEHQEGTPSLSADELKAMIDAGDDLVVLDSRPWPEYHARNIPTGICCPGAELAYRVHDLAPSPATTVVVNCAGRTRSIIGAQSLRNAGIPNRVLALRNGTMGWHLAGYTLEAGMERHYREPTERGLAAAKEAAERVASRFGVRTIDRATLEQWQAEGESRSLYLLDVRSPEEYAAGHLPGTRSAPGGQLVQETDMFVPTLRARIVLVDDTGVRATMTASWLVQMGWKHVAVLEGGIGGSTLLRGAESRPVLGLDAVPPASMRAHELARRLEAGDVTVIDLSLSRAYRAGHVPGAWHAVRARLPETLARARVRGTVVLVSEDGRTARLARPEVEALVDGPVEVLIGGTADWRAEGRPLEAGDGRMLGAEGAPWVDPGDVWLRPYESGGDVEKAMQSYLTWEVNLVEQIARDGTAEWLRA